VEEAEEAVAAVDVATMREVNVVVQRTTEM
jgi:hypothetical protein